MGIVENMKESLAENRDRRQKEKFMKAAIKEAEKAARINEVPIGCVIVREGKVIAKGYNRRNTDKNVLCHAEISAIKDACKKAKDWRLEDCDLYVTLEPCPMCAGAIVQARIPNVYIAAMNPKAGCAGSVINLLEMAGFNHQCNVERGILEEEASGLLTSFFRDLREEKKAIKAGEEEDNQTNEETNQTN